MNALQQNYLDNYLETLSPSRRSRHTSFSAGHFCADEYNANTCSDLVLAGTKTATCCMRYWYEEDREPMPTIGHLHVVTDWSGAPTAIIETTHIEECAFREVTAEFARAEGEGDKSLGWWREAHWNYFSRECAELGIESTEDMMLVLETFRRVYP